MAATIKQIAELSGVSRGTVDRVLHNRGGVDPQIAKKIQKIAKENGYHIEVLFLALMEPGDLMGMPNIKDVGHTSITEWASPGWFQRMIDSAWAPEFNFSDLEFKDKDFEKFVISSIK